LLCEPKAPGGQGQGGGSCSHQKGSHAVYYREKDKARVVIPMHADKNLRPKILAGILDNMGVTPEEFQRLLRE